MIKKVTVVALLAAVLTSCSTSNEVVSNGFFQKRKYNKGWYANKSTKIKETKGDNAKDVVLIEGKIAQEKTLKSSLEIKIISNDFITKKEEVVKSIGTVLASVDKKEEKIVSTSVVIANEKNTTIIGDLEKVSEIAPVEIKQGKSQTGDTSSNGHPMILLYLLAIFIPPIAVGLVTDWEATPTISNLLWTLLCGIPGIIHAFIIIARYR